MSRDVPNFQPTRGQEIISHRHTKRKSTYWQVLLYEQLLQKQFRNLFIGSGDIEQTNIWAFFMKRPVGLYVISSQVSIQDLSSKGVVTPHAYEGAAFWLAKAVTTWHEYV